MTNADEFYRLLIKNILSIVSYIGECFCILSVFIIMLCFLGKDREGRITRKTVIPFIIMVGTVTCVNVYCIYRDYMVLKNTWNEPYIEGAVRLVDKSDFEWIIYIIVIGAIIAAALFTFTKKRLMNTIMSALMIVFFESYVSTEMMCSAMYFSEEPREYVLNFKMQDQLLGTTGSYIFTLSYVMIMISIFLVLYFGMYKAQRTVYVGWRNRIFFIVWELLMICVMCVPIMFGVSGSDQVRYMRYELAIILPVVGFAVPFLLVAIISRRYVLEKTMIQEDYISAELNYINQYKKNQQETRAFRHDIINNLSMLSAIHDGNNYDEAQEYLNTLLGNVRAMSPKYNTGDEMLDCIVGMKSSKMDEEGIDFTLDGVIDGGLGMRPVDICSIFANALDNAIEACERIPDESDRWIRLDIKRTDKFFSILLSNSMTDDAKAEITDKLFKDGERITSKKDRSLHGYGTQNMKTTISKYDGIEKVEAGGGIFKLSIMIPRKE